MAALTLTQQASIAGDSTFLSKIVATLRAKASYWTNFATNSTPNRADVNVQLQKRVRLAEIILKQNWAEGQKQQVGAYWLTLYTTSNPILDGNGIPVDDEIFNQFDPSYDYFAGVVSADAADIRIQW